MPGKKKILQGIAFGSSPYRFHSLSMVWRLFGATFKTKERLTRRLLQQHTLAGFSDADNK